MYFRKAKEIRNQQRMVFILINDADGKCNISDPAQTATERFIDIYDKRKTCQNELLPLPELTLQL